MRYRDGSAGSIPVIALKKKTPEELFVAEELTVTAAQQKQNTEKWKILCKRPRILAIV
jgi:hypothetical protein